MILISDRQYWTQNMFSEEENGCFEHVAFEIFGEFSSTISIIITWIEEQK